MGCSDKEIGKRIAKMRKLYRDKDGKKLTQDGLAKAVCLSRTIIAKIESGIQPALPNQLFDFAKLFGVTVDYLVSGVSSENRTASDELGLAHESLETLKQWQRTTVTNGKPGPDEFARNRLYALNALVQLDQGNEALDDIFHYLVTDFGNAWYVNESLGVDEDGQPVGYFTESNTVPITELHFDSAVPNAGKGVRLSVDFMRYALLEDIIGKIKKMREAVSSQRKTLAEREKELEKSYQQALEDDDGMEV